MTNKNETVITEKPAVTAIRGTTPHAQRRELRRKRDEEELARLEKEREEMVKAQLQSAEQQEVEEEDNASSEPEPEESESENLVDATPDESEEAEQAEDTTEQVEAEEEPVKEKKQSDHNWEKRYKDLQRHSTKLTQRLKELESKTEEKTVSKVSEEDVKNWMEKYPAVSSIVQKLAEDIAVNSSKDLREQMEKLNDIRQEVLLQKAEAEIAEKHPDFKELRQSDAFHNWVEKKPAWVSKALYEDIDDVDNIVEIISWYKTSTAYKPKTVKKTDNSKAAAKSVEPKGQNTSTKPKMQQKKYDFTISQIEAMSLSEFEKNQEAIDEARRQGRVFNDKAAAMVG
jgi:hypothetical protein